MAPYHGARTVLTAEHPDLTERSARGYSGLGAWEALSRPPCLEDGAAGGVDGDQRHRLPGGQVLRITSEASGLPPR
jgi:hypothetical protein